MTEAEIQMKYWIDNANYYDLLLKWRQEPAGSVWFTGAIGKYYTEIMRQKRNETPHDEQVAASKAIG